MSGESEALGLKEAQQGDWRFSDHLPRDILTLRSIYDILHGIYDKCEDDIDRVFLGSSNDRDVLRSQLFRIERLLDAAVRAHSQESTTHAS